MNIRKRFIYSLLSVSVLFPLSCKKKSTGLGDVKLATVNIVSSSDNLHYRMTYDASNNVDSIVLTGSGMSSGRYGYLKFVYYTLSYSITNETGATFVVAQNSDANIKKINVTDTPSMLYENGRLVEVDNKSPSNTYPFIVKKSSYINWTDGDITAITYTGSSQTYSYDKAHTGQLGDAIRIDQFLLYGRPYYKSSHVPVQLSYNNNLFEKYYYQFDGSGRISEMMRVRITNTSANDTIVYTYGYY